MLEISFIPAFKDNYIWLLTDQNRHAVVVDPGDAAPVMARLVADGLHLDAILVTHHHADHQGGVAELAKHWSARVFAPAEESITGCTDPLFGGEVIALLGHFIQVWAVPGHTLGHLAYGLPGALFCGDTLFGAGCGRLFEGTPEQMHASLALIKALPDETRVYCAHEYTEANLRFAQAVEPESADLRERVEQVSRLRAQGLPSVPSTVGEEKKTNPFLRCDVPAVLASALRHGAVADAGEVPVFAALRSWRNGF